MTTKPFTTQFIIYLMLIYIVKFGLNCYSNKGNLVFPKYFNSAIIIYDQWKWWFICDAKG